MDAVSACHSAVLSAAQASAALRALNAYHERFRGRLAPGVGPSAKRESLCSAVASRGSSRHVWMRTCRWHVCCKPVPAPSAAHRAFARPPLRDREPTLPCRAGHREQQAHPDNHLAGKGSPRLSGVGPLIGSTPRHAAKAPGQGQRGPCRGAHACSYGERLPFRHWPGQHQPVPASQVCTGFGAVMLSKAPV